MKKLLPLLLLVLTTNFSFASINALSPMDQMSYCNSNTSTLFTDLCWGQSSNTSVMNSMIDSDPYNRILELLNSGNVNSFNFNNQHDPFSSNLFSGQLQGISNPGLVPSNMYFQNASALK